MNLTGITYAFGNFGVRIYILYGLVPLCRISRKHITKVYTANSAANFFESLGRAYRGWQFGNRLTHTILVVETDIFLFHRFYLTPIDPHVAMALLYRDKHARAASVP